jgi:hypothetical protein
MSPVSGYVDCESRTAAKAVVVGGLFYVGAVGAAGSVVASGGTLVAAVEGAAIAGGVGGLIGVVLAILLHQHDAGYVGQQLARGGLLLWVRTADRDRETRACQVLKRQAALDVDVRDVVHARADLLAQN